MTRRPLPLLLALLPLAIVPATLPPAPAQAEAEGRSIYLPWLGRAAERDTPPPPMPSPPPHESPTAPSESPTPPPAPPATPPPGPLRLSEIAPTGGGILDEDGEASDWVEIHNTGAAALSLGGYALSDDPRRPDRWRLPPVTLDPDERRVVFASGKDRPASAGGGEAVPADHWETAVQDGSRWRFTLGRADIPAEWRQPGFVDADWEEGPGGIGYGDGDDGTEVPEGSISVFARTEFTVRDRGKVTDLLLHMDFDDGFVAYLNGIEIARQGLAGAPPAWDEPAVEHEALLYQGQTPPAFPVDRRRMAELLVAGRNVLAVEVHNLGADSSDLTLRPFLHLGLADAGSQFDPNPPWFRPPGAAAGALHSNFRLKAGETLRLTAPGGLAADAADIPSALHRGHVLARVGEAWCLSDSPSPGAPNGGICCDGYAKEPTLGLAPGFYAGRQTLALGGADLRYTLDGRLPDADATRYRAPIVLTRSVVLRALALEAGKLPSEVVTAAYFIDEPTELPVVSVVAAPGDLFTDGAGGGPAIYDNFESGLKVPGEVAYFDAARQQRFSERAALRVVGNFSKAFAQKSLQFTFEDDFGARGDVPNALFTEDKPALGKLHGFRVRNTDDDANSTRMRDTIANRMALPTHAAATASQNVAVFVNGAYWGHYVARELLNEYYVRDNFGADPDAVDIVKTHVGTTFADAGSQQDFDDLATFLSTADLGQAANMAEARRRADLDNWIDYWATQIYIANGDWYSSQWLNNIQAFRAGPPADNRWRFVLWDCAYSQAFAGGESSAAFDSLAFALRNPVKPNVYTDMFNGLLRNDSFRRDFVNRFADLLNEAWTPASMAALIDENARRMASEMRANHLRWAKTCGSYCPPDLELWKGQVADLKDFHRDRPAFQRAQLLAYFGLDKTVAVTLRVEPPGAGRVRISSIIPTSMPWTGTYFDGNPVTVSAHPAPGFVFAGWVPNAAIVDPLRPEFTANIDAAATTFTARFARAGARDGDKQRRGVAPSTSSRSDIPMEEPRAALPPGGRQRTHVWRTMN